ncbi:MAG: DUF3536 domain-containing protein [Gemmatimonadota bacterium]|nr:DUF3536 domain-containing protein [Gemmatimonadota bacterium]
MPSRSIVIHGHFYQPPREDPWLDLVAAEPSAAPFHDWNERIEQECYRAVAAARVPGMGGRIARIENTYEWISFNFGPTLLEWMEHAAPETYAAVLLADRLSAARLGHGNAIAMPYHHAILPLSTRREKLTEVDWGIADFRRRFGRMPEGMWLPETAVDEETLDVLAEAGIRFTILAPHQVDPLPPGGRPGIVTTTSGRTIVVCVYDGALAHDVAFGPLVRDAEAWTARLLVPAVDPASPAVLVSLATDGETWGHHHAFGEMALASTLNQLRDRPGIRVENFAAFLAREPATHPVTLVAPSSWSCSHGVERWRSDCGCRINQSQPPSQAWRAPLRDALGWLTAECHAIYDRESPAVLQDPASALDGYGAVIGAGADAVRTYVAEVARTDADAAGRVRAAELLELERGALRSLTSCAWFFDDLGGIETLQVLRYAAWAISLSGAGAGALESGLTARLAPARSNQRSLGTGKDLYLGMARPVTPHQTRIAAGLAAARRLAPEAATTPAWAIDGPDHRLRLTNRRTGHEEHLALVLTEAELDLSIVVASALTEEPVTLTLVELPERQREAVGGALRARCLEILLDAEERLVLGRGDALRPVVRHALVRRVRLLANEQSEVAERAVVLLLTILEQLGQTVPFEVQTLFYPIWRRSAGADPGITALARCMGFDVRTSGAYPP